jgi:hypothetical protein
LLKSYERTKNGEGQESETDENAAEKTSSAAQLEQVPCQLWQLAITELAGHNIEAHGREEVNRMLNEGWMLLHIYTVHYQDDGIWRQRPMAILGRSARGAASSGPSRVSPHRSRLPSS